MTAFERARTFIYRSARPLDLARWQFHFEGGSREAVLTALAAYQNEDGGFGHAIEPDFWNPNSTPIGTWAAACILREIGMEEVSHPVFAGLLRYLDSGADFSAEHDQWLNAVPSNNDHPHAVWWEWTDNENFRYNPSAMLGGFIVRYAERESGLYEKGVRIVKEAAQWLEQNTVLQDDILNCYAELYRCLIETDVNAVDMAWFGALVIERVNGCICREPERWFTDYVPKPSVFIDGPDSPFYAGNEELVQTECRLILEQQQPDGAWPVTWRWWNDYKEFEIAANWWKSHFIIGNIRYLKSFGFI